MVIFVYECTELPRNLFITHATFFKKDQLFRDSLYQSSSICVHVHTDLYPEFEIYLVWKFTIKFRIIFLK